MIKTKVRKLALATAIGTVGLNTISANATDGIPQIDNYIQQLETMSNNEWSIDYTVDNFKHDQSSESIEATGIFVTGKNNLDGKSFAFTIDSVSLVGDYYGQNFSSSVKGIRVDVDSIISSMGNERALSKDQLIGLNQIRTLNENGGISLASSGSITPSYAEYMSSLELPQLTTISFGSSIRSSGGSDLTTIDWKLLESGDQAYAQSVLDKFQLKTISISISDEGIVDQAIKDLNERSREKAEEQKRVPSFEEFVYSVEKMNGVAVEDSELDSLRRFYDTEFGGAKQPSYVLETRESIAQKARMQLGMGASMFSDTQEKADLAQSLVDEFLKFLEKGETFTLSFTVPDDYPSVMGVINDFENKSKQGINPMLMLNDVVPMISVE